MAISVGEILDTEGTVQVLNTETNEVRVVESGGKLYANEVVITGDGSAVTLQLIDGNIVALGRETRMTLDNSVIPVNSLNAMTADQVASFEALQQAILDGNVDELEQAGSELPPEVAAVLEARSKSVNPQEEQEPVSSSNDGGDTNQRIALVGEVTAGYDTTAEFFDTTQDLEDEGEDDNLVLNILPIEPETPVIPENNDPQIPNEENEENEQTNNNRDEAPSSVLIKLFALDAEGNRVDVNQVPEGLQPSYVVVAFDNEGQEIPVTGTVTVRFVDQSATGTPVGTRDDGTQDYINESLTVTLGEAFDVDTVDDYLADNGETYLAEIVEETLDMDETFDEVLVDDTPVTTTIIDDSQPGTPNDSTDGIEPDMDSVTLKLIPTDANGNEIDPVTIPEGETAYYKVILLDPNGNEITNATGNVDVVFTDGTAVRTGTAANGEQDFDGQNQTIALNTVFSADALDDYLADSGETFNVAIVDDTYTEAAKYENVIHDTTPVVTTIIDDSQPGTPNDPSDSVEPNQEVVMIKLFAADANGNVLKDGSGNYQLANSVDEGSNANYIAYAFAPGTTSYNDSTRLANQLGQVTVTFNDGNGANGAQGAGTQTAVDGSQDFVNNGQTITLGQSFNTATFTDAELDDNETYTVTLNANSYTPVAQGGYETVEINTAPVTTTINDVEPKMFVKIEPVTDTVAESGELKYKLTIVDASGAEVPVPVGGSIDVSLEYAGLGNSPATKDTDYTPDISVTISGGNSSQEFTVPTIDDYYAEGDEQLQITISDVTDTGGAFESIVPHTVDNGAPSDEITAEGTIQDNPVNNPENGTTGTPNEPTDPNNPGNGESYGPEDTVYAIITGPDSVNEGDTTTEYTVKLIDKDGNEVKVTQATDVTVTYTNVTTEDGDTVYNNDNTITVTIPADGSSNTFTVDTNDDYYAEGDEDYKLAITQVDTNEFENTVIGDKDGNRKDVTTTIHDDSPGNQIETDPDNTKIILVATNSAGDIPLDGDGKVDVTKNTNATPEGGKLYYIAVAIDEEGKQLTTQNGTVEVAYGATPDNTDKDATAGTDYDNTTVISATIGTVFSVDARDDYYAEGDENFTVTISNPQNTPYESPSIDTNHDEVISTITDNPANEKQDDGSTGNDDPTNGSYDEDDTVYVKIIDNASVVEGNDLVHHIQLVDKEGNAVVIPDGETLTVTLTYSTDTGTITSGDFVDGSNKYNENSTVTVTLDKDTPVEDGIYKLPITNTTIDDFTFEGDEKYTLTITDVAQDQDSFENIAIGDVDGNNTSVTGTIKDGVTTYKDDEYIDPENAIVDEDKFVVTEPDTKISNKDGNASDGTNTYQGELLNIIKPSADDGYELVFDNTINVYKGDKDSTTEFAYDDNSTELKSGGEVINYKVDGNKITGYTGDEANYESNKVFEIVLNKDSDISSGTTTKDNFTYTQYKNIDHPIKGTVGTDTDIDDNITFEFGFKIKDQNNTESDTVKFKVTVNDSLPESEDWTENVNEDGSVQIVISPENFSGGYIEIKNKEGGSYTKLGNTASGDIVTSIDIYDPTDTSVVIGQLTTAGDGTVLFTPNGDYSNYAQKPWFEYAVSDFDGDQSGAKVSIDVKPVADAPTIFVKDVSTTEDDGNTAEGTHKVNLGLKTPLLSKDSEETQQTTPTGYAVENNDNNEASYNSTSTPDQNGDTISGDNPERNGEITLTFTNGDDVTGAKVFSGATEVATIDSADQELKVIIVKDDKSDIDYTYHHAEVISGTFDINNPPTYTLYLTQTEYEALQIQHAEDNDTDIDINISVTSYELDDSDKPLSDVDGNTSNADMTVKINPVTDKFTLNWDGTTNDQVQSVDTGTKTVVFKDIAENNSNPEAGAVVNNSLDLKALLTATSGTSSVGSDNTFDLDGSEKRSYTISLTETGGKALPEFIYITIGSKTDVKAYNDGSGNYSVAFDGSDNKVADPEFSMKFPDYWSGSVTGTITLKSQDEGADSTDTAGSVESDSVNFKVTVTPVANLATIQVAQSVGYEDAGRDGGNTDAKSDAINANGTGGIPLDIKVSSDDEDGSETFNVKISDIPDNAVIYYDGSVVSQSPAGTVQIDGFDNTKSLVIIPPHNDDSDFTLKVKAQSVDGTDTVTWESAPEKDIDVIVKNIADAPVGTELKASIDVNEDNQLDFKDIYQDSSKLASYDSSEELTVKIDLPDGFSIASGSPYYIQDGMYVVKASDIKDGKIELVVPKDFSGDASFGLTYVTTEKAGEGDSKTWDTQTVNIFVNPIADDVTVADSSTIYEDADGGANKINLKPTLTDTDENGTETIESVKILASSVPAGYKLYSDTNMTTELTTTNESGTDYYVLTAAQADSVYIKNTTEHDADSGDNFNLSVTYTVTDTNGTESDTKDFTHTHTVNVQAVTDNPALNTGTIVQESGNVTIVGTTVTVNAENSQFKVPVTTTSPDGDGSEKITEIVISGVPMGVSIEGATYYGYSGSGHNGIWVITNPSDNPLDGDALENITFKVNQGANFEDRDITITTYTQDVDAEVEIASQTITIKKSYTPGEEPGNPAELELSVKEHDIVEDTEFTLADVLAVGVKEGGSQGNGGAVITFTDIPEGSTVSGYDYSYEEGGKTYYVVTGSGNAADMNTQLSDVKITTPKDMNSGQEGALKGDFTFTADIATYHGGGFNNGNQVSSTQDIAPLTDAMTVDVSAENIDEDGTSELSITLSNPSDGSKTELIGNSITIKVTETWADTATGGGTAGTLTDSSGKYDIAHDGNGTYTITPKDAADNFTVGESITGLQYTPAENRDGSVNFEVTVQNKETGSDVTLDSTGNTSITVTPEIDIELNAQTVIASGTEDIDSDSVGLANPVKFEIKTDAITDGSETLGNIILDEVPNGFTVWYKDASDTLVMATNIGTTGGGTFDLTPNIDGDDEVARNKWLVPNTDGTMPDIYINAPVNWSGDFDFKATVNVKEENLSSYVSETVSVTGHIDAVADDMTIDPTLTFGDALDWIDLNLNANMVDVDGSETMTVTLTAKDGSDALQEGMKFQLSDGTSLDGNATFDNGTYTITGVAYDQINNIQMLYGHYDGTISVSVKTVETTNSDEGTPATGEFEFKSQLGNSDDYEIKFSSGGIFNGDGTYDGTVTVQKDGVDVEFILPSGTTSLSFGNGTYTLEEIYNNIDESGDPTVMSAVIIDGIIEGMSYQTTSGLTGLTDAEGAFEYREGDSVTFSIGGVVLGTATASDLEAGILFLQDLADVELTNLSDEYVQKMAVFLQSLDSEGNTADGLQISEQARNALANTTLNLSSASMDDVTTALVAAGVTPISVDEAMSHVQEMLITHSDLEADDFERLDNVAAAESVDEALAMIDETDLELEEEQAADEAVANADAEPEAAEAVSEAVVSEVGQDDVEQDEAEQDESSMEQDLLNDSGVEIEVEAFADDSSEEDAEQELPEIEDVFMMEEETVIFEETEDDSVVVSEMITAETKKEAYMDVNDKPVVNTDVEDTSDF